MAADKAYFLSGSTYVRYDVAADRVDAGYPRDISAGWTGTGAVAFGSDIDAAVDLGQGKIYFFKGGDYIRLDAAANSVDGGYPRATGDSWSGTSAIGFDQNLDAATNWGNGTLYLFKGAQYVSYDIVADAVSGSPASIGDDWPGMADAGFADGLDAVVWWPNGKAYAFKGDQYVRLDQATRSVDADYPKAIADGWPTLSAAGMGSNISAGYVKVSAGVPSGPAGNADDLSDDFFRLVKQVSQSLQCAPEDLLGVMESESEVRPSAQNPHGQATGLIQFMPATLQGLGWTQGPDAFAQLTAEAQMPYVEKYFHPYVAQGLGSAGRLYQATFLPATLSMGSDESTVIAAPGGPNASAYTSNPGLDMDHDGTITVGDLTARIDQVRSGGRWQALMARLAAV